jgi:hypothetical protein
MLKDEHYSQVYKNGLKIIPSAYSFKLFKKFFNLKTPLKYTL